MFQFTEHGQEKLISRGLRVLLNEWFQINIGVGLGSVLALMLPLVLVLVLTIIEVVYIFQPISSLLYHHFLLFYFENSYRYIFFSFVFYILLFAKCFLFFYTLGTHNRPSLLQYALFWELGSFWKFHFADKRDMIFINDISYLLGF